MSALRSVSVIFLVGLLFQLGSTSIGTGDCPDVTVVQNFNATRYVGTWYEIEKYYQMMEIGGCIQAVYSPTDEANVVSVVNTQTLLFGVKSSISGTATLDDPSEAKMTVAFNFVPFASPYWILDTDYETYSVVLSCSGLGNFVHDKYVWILGRERSLSDSVLEKVYAVLEKNGLDTDSLLKTDQENCS